MPTMCLKMSSFKHHPMMLRAKERMGRRLDKKRFVVLHSTSGDSFGRGMHALLGKIADIHTVDG